MFFHIHVFHVKYFAHLSNVRRIGCLTLGDLSYAGRRRGNLTGLAVKRCDRPSKDDELREQHSWGTPYCSNPPTNSQIMSLMMKPKFFEADKHQNT